LKTITFWKITEKKENILAIIYKERQSDSFKNCDFIIDIIKKSLMIFSFYY